MEFKGKPVTRFDEQRVPGWFWASFTESIFGDEFPGGMSRSRLGVEFCAVFPELA